MGEVLDIVSGNAEPAYAPSGPGTQLRRVASRRRFIACIQAFDYGLFSLIVLIWCRTLAQNAIGDWWPVHVAVSLLGAAMLHCVFQSFRLYDFTVLTRGTNSAVRALTAGIISIGPFLGPLLLPGDPAKQPAATACALVATGLLGISISRLGFARLARTLQQTGVVDRRVYIVADSSKEAASLRDRLQQSPGNRVVGTWTLASAMGPIEGALEGCLGFLRNNPIDLVILKMPLSQPARLAEAARVLRSLPLTILLAPSLGDGDDIVLESNVSHPDGLDNLVLVKLSDRPLAGWRWVIKDIQDRALAVLLLTIVSPALVTIAIAIKLSDPGPVFFRQKRFGYAGETFNIFKFRTMRVADTAGPPGTLTLTKKEDPRVFPVGRVLRKTSLDELPQLLNVLLGDMWIIGPRPHSPYATAEGLIYGQAVREYAARYRIKPGITGWAQVCGWRGPTETLEQLAKRVEHDLYYIENWSTFFDQKILFRTLFCVFNQKNAF